MLEAAMRDATKRNLRVGLLTVVAVAILVLTVFTIGNRRQLFTRHTRYRTSFTNVTGLQNGAEVKLNGVTVGFVEDIHLPTDPEDERIMVRFTLDADYTERIREDTFVSIKTIGLLGDKYLEIRGGSPTADRVLEGGMLTARDPAEMEEFLVGGEDLMENLISISQSLMVILRRVEAGEGLLGELTQVPRSGEKLSDMVKDTLASLRYTLVRIEEGDGLLGRMIRDEEYADRLLENIDSSADSMSEVASTISSDLNREDSAYALLFRDGQGAALLRESLAAMRDATHALAAAVEELATGEGTLPRLMKDKEYADDFLDDLGELMHHLQSVAEKIDEGDGTLGAFVNDPQMYKDLEHVVRGVKNSKLSSWYVRNRRAKGEELEAREAAEAASEPTEPGQD
jgi:phospholipid/cholesterol/gamma-HCH transport system substrate-binding protein